MKTEDGLTKWSIDRNVLIIIVIWIALAIIFGLYDLEISKEIVNPNLFWAKFGREYGPYPGYGLIASAIVVLLASPIEDPTRQRSVAYCVIAIGIFIIALGAFLANHFLIKLGSSVFISITLLLILTSRSDLRDHRTMAMVILLLAIINPLIFVESLKVLTGRVRFDELAIGFSNYTPWYLPPGPSLEHASFPSGHTAMGWMLLPLLIIPKIRSWRTSYYLALFTIITIWGLFVGVSRIVIGAHYASDVLFSTGVAFLTTFYLYKHYFQSEKKQLDTITKHGPR